MMLLSFHTPRVAAPLCRPFTQEAIIDFCSCGNTTKLSGSLLTFFASVKRFCTIQNENRQTSATTYDCEDVKDGLEEMTPQFIARTLDPGEI